ncbi:MAG: GNAT family N-acetyltransferase [Prevotella sp.]|nr:GNAT family N-acetyltransferase [Prevotella sp.]
MNKFSVTIITKSEDLPQMECNNFFHSSELFRMIERTPGQWPYMVLAYDNSKVIAHMLVMLRRRGSLIPPYLFTQGRIYGEGMYVDGYDKEELFGEMLRTITKKLVRKLCLYIEFSDLSTKMFGYEIFRDNGFFPVRWMAIHNSLHSKEPEKRLKDNAKKHLAHAVKSGISTSVTNDEKSLVAFFKILKTYVSLNIRRYIPDSSLFLGLFDNGHCKLFTTKEKEKMTAGCICLYSENNCYLWYLASKKNLHKKRTNTMTVWAAIKDAYEMGCEHIYFLDVGLPSKKNRFRNFILSFGGKPVGTYRWFRCSFKWVNKIVAWVVS